MERNQSQPIQIGWTRADDQASLLSREWLVTNGLGGYASGTIGGAGTRRFHGLLIAALPAPLGRLMMLNHLEEWVETPDGKCWRLNGDEQGDNRIKFPEEGFLEEFAVESGLPVWRYAKDGIRIEKRVLMPHLQNSTYVVYKLVSGPPNVTLNLRPSLHIRPHEGLLTGTLPDTWTVETNGNDIDICDHIEGHPTLRVMLFGNKPRLERDERKIQSIIYRIERSRGYESEGILWSPGLIRMDLIPGEDAGLVASVEVWDVVRA
ncbi:MAG: glycogen debranching enzyme N-terminal domain-containing protein, partial [Thermoanaerobaculia bacterium]